MERGDCSLPCITTLAFETVGSFSFLASRFHKPWSCKLTAATSRVCRFLKYERMYGGNAEKFILALKFGMDIMSQRT